MTNQHPITPPPELVQQWTSEWMRSEAALPVCRVSRDNFMTARAAQWGADQELEACVDFVQYEADWNTAEKLRAARRPKPATLNSIALQMLGCIEQSEHFIPEITDTIRRALEALPE